MKKKLLCSILVSAIIAGTLSGCGTTTPDTASTMTVPTAIPIETTGASEDKKTETVADSTVNVGEETKTTEGNTPSSDKIYSDIIYSAGRVVAVPSYDYDPKDGEDGIWETAVYCNPAEAANNVGYSITDINGDGVEELIFGVMEGSEADYLSYGCPILAVYTISNNHPYLVFSGWSRNNYFYLGDGRFLNEGSDGAMSSVVATYKLPAGENDLECEDFYFTYVANVETYEMGICHNTTGQWDAEHSDIANMTTEQLWSYEENLEKTVKNIPLTSLKEVIRPAVDVTVSKDLGNGNSTLNFGAQGVVKDFKLLDLFVNDMDNMGNYIFAVTEKSGCGEIPEGQSVEYDVTFAGDLPDVGFSYVDEKGTVRQFYIAISGMDGSLIVCEF